jgi:hypothetical protein
MGSLSAETLASTANQVPAPDYDRSRVTTGVVHFGVGGFHRATGRTSRGSSARSRSTCSPPTTPRR